MELSRFHNPIKPYSRSQINKKMEPLLKLHFALFFFISMQDNRYLELKQHIA